tara:strand:- start:584 stop:1126 length:543 start_codon:yes stop_codon:yes gene_type:complete
MNRPLDSRSALLTQADSAAALTPAYKETVLAVIAHHQHTPGALLPILHEIQEHLGYLPPQAFALIADALRQTRAEIQGVVSFYPHFRQTAPGRSQLQICRAEACQARGARALEQYVQARLKLGYHQTSADQEYSLEPVYCLGNCACGPSMRVNDEVIGRVTPERFERLLDELTTQPLEIS